jgi:hypothetical protein
MFHTLFTAPTQGLGLTSGSALQPSSQRLTHSQPGKVAGARLWTGVFSALVAEACQCSRRGETRRLSRSCLFRIVLVDFDQRGPSHSDRVGLGVQ